MDKKIQARLIQGSFYFIVIFIYVGMLIEFIIIKNPVTLLKSFLKLFDLKCLK